MTTSKFNGLFLIILFAVLLGCSPEKKINKPNILLIVADDMGYSDLGFFGGEISTPNIDALADQGIAFSSFYTAPTCAPTRAMLLSGNDNHIAGMGSQFRLTGEWGYEGHLTDRVVTFPQLLRDNGYHTYMTGKWHLGMEEDQSPHVKGFENSFVVLRGAANHYDDQGIFKETPISLYRDNGELAKWPEGEYSTDLYTQKLIEFIDQNRADQKPFFAMAAYTSPHWPLQVGEEFWKKYEGRYKEGYEILREERLKSLIENNIIPENSTLPPLHKSVKPWDSLSVEEKKIEERKMELYAGMVDNLDFHVGKI